MNLAEMVPRNDLASTEYCLATFRPLQRKGRGEYLVYLPEGGSVTVNLSDASGELAVEWLNPCTGERVSGGVTTGGGNREFTSPFSGDAVLYIVAKSLS
jgi:hypothetical protein